MTAPRRGLYALGMCDFCYRPAIGKLRGHSRLRAAFGVAQKTVLFCKVHMTKGVGHVR